MKTAWIIGFTITCASGDTSTCPLGLNPEHLLLERIFQTQEACNAQIPVAFAIDAWEWPAEFEYRAACLPIPFDPTSWPIVVPADPGRN